MLAGVFLEVFDIDLIWMNAAALVLALSLDIVLGDPPNIVHPVAYIGKLIAFLERLGPKANSIAQLFYGAAMALVIPAALATAGYFLTVALKDLHPAVYIVIAGVLLKMCFSVRNLGKTALAVKDELEANDPDHRKSLSALVSRDTTNLTSTQVAGAAVESVAENTTDSFVAPWLFFALFGLPGIFAYRAVNTLDSMIGYRGKYEYLGKASARLDDILNLIPSRISALIIIIASSLQRYNYRLAFRLVFSEGHSTSSPNAGLTMAAMAGALGVTLEKSGHYLLGSGLREPGPPDIIDSVKLMYLVAMIAFLFVLAIMVVIHVI